MQALKRSESYYVKAALCVLSVATAILLVAVIVLGCWLHTMWWRQNTDTFAIRSLLRDAINGLYQPTVVGPREKLQYAYQASVDFPLPTGDQQPFRYGYVAAENGFKEQLTLTTQTVLNAGFSQLAGANPAELFKHVPTYQRCSTELIVQFAKDVGDDKFALAAAKKLNDGRTAYIYQNEYCKNFY
ncbi:MAG TPA: hypothetical protein VF466_00710, partial [Candidatus Saccharimonadales bacterium]